ncbi:MAG: glycosyltransferase family 2 protein [Patescibacteria group bacterium]|jgi:glycosyltransferase involved in cell wall biosynthesis
MKLAIIIPAYNEAEKISSVVLAVKAAQPESLIVIIDDGSSDATAELAASAGADVLRHKINRGQGAALKTGIEYALRRHVDAAVFFDADGQMESQEIKLLAAKLAEGYDAVLGSRNLGRALNMPLMKRITKKLALYFTCWTTGLKLTDTHNGFQAWAGTALKLLDLGQDRQAYASEVLHEIKRLKLKYCEVPVTIHYTDYSIKKGQSIWNAFGILWDLLIK